MTDIDPIEAALQQLLQERADLDTVIAGLQKRLGKASVDVTASTHSGLLTATARPLASASVYRGDFFNLSVTAAAEKLLKRVGRQLKTPEILSALKQAEFEIKSKTPRATIYTSLRRSKDFVKVAPDTWDLSERHPDAARTKEQERQAKAAKTKQQKRKTVKAVKAEVVEGLKVA